MTTPIPHIASLNSTGRMWLLSWLHFEVMCGRPITAESWRVAFGKAADYQMVAEGRRELARSERVAA